MESLTNLQGPLFDKARALVERSGPAEEYLARAVHASDGCYYAIWAAPGWVPTFVLSPNGDGAEIFTDINSAEAKAREELFNILNANLRDGIE